MPNGKILLVVGGTNDQTVDFLNIIAAEQTVVVMEGNRGMLYRQEDRAQKNFGPMYVGDQQISFIIIDWSSFKNKLGVTAKVALSLTELHPKIPIFCLGKAD